MRTEEILQRPQLLARTHGAGILPEKMEGGFKLSDERAWAVRLNPFFNFNFICTALFTVDRHKDALHGKQEKWQISALSPKIAYEVNSPVGENPSKDEIRFVI